MVEQGVPSEEAASELSRRGRTGAIASLVQQGVPSEEAASEHGRRGRTGAIASLVRQGVLLEEAASELGHRGRTGAIASLVEQGVPSEEAASEHGRRGGAGNRLKGKFVDLHGYFVVQEIDKNNVPCNPRTDRKSTSWSSIAMYLASDNVMIRYAASSIVKKQKFKPVGYVDKILTPKNNKDKR